MKTFSRATLILNPITGAFLISLAFWFYLFLTTQTFVSADAVSYEQHGSFFYEGGLAKYFHHGIPREPLYPLTIALSMRLGDFFHTSYLAIQRIFQIFILCLTQFLLFRLLKKMRIDDRMIAATILYFAVSPAVVNSAFCLFSEIMNYPFVIGAVWSSIYSWRAIHEKENRKAILGGFLMAFCFVFLTFNKAIFEIIMPIYLLVFFYPLLRSLLKKQKRIFISSGFFLLSSILVFQSCVAAYKFQNLKYNGSFVFTDRGPWLFYGNTARRTGQLTPRKLLSNVAYTFGEGVCQSFFSQEDCNYWSFHTSDNLGLAKLNELKHDVAVQAAVDHELVRASLKKILSNPWQYGLLFIIESQKMLLWESTKVGFVAYPPWLTRLYDWTPLKNGLRLLIYLLTLFSLLSLIVICVGNKSKINDTQSKAAFDAQAVFFILIFLFTYIAMHSLVSIVIRYATPIIPLYVIGIAYSAQNFMSRFSKPP